MVISERTEEVRRLGEENFFKGRIFGLGNFFFQPSSEMCPGTCWISMTKIQINKLTYSWNASQSCGYVVIVIKIHIIVEQYLKKKNRVQLRTAKKNFNIVKK